MVVVVVWTGGVGGGGGDNGVCSTLVEIQMLMVGAFASVLSTAVLFKVFLSFAVRVVDSMSSLGPSRRQPMRVGGRREGCSTIAQIQISETFHFRSFFLSLVKGLSPAKELRWISSVTSFRGRAEAAVVVEPVCSRHSSRSSFACSIER